MGHWISNYSVSKMSQSTVHAFAKDAPGAYRHQPHWTEHERAIVAERYPLLDVSPKLGEAWFPVVYKDGRDAALPGFLVKVCAHYHAYTGQPVKQPIADAARRWVACLAGVDDESLPKKLGDIRLSIPNMPVNHKDGVPLEIDGPSHGLACAVAILSLILERTPKHTVIVSGQLTSDLATGEVAAIQYVDLKERIVALEVPGRDMNEIALMCSRTTVGDHWLEGPFGSDWREVLFQGFDVDPATKLDGLWKQFFWDENRRATRSIRNACQSLVGHVEGSALMKAHWILGAIASTRGDTDEAITHLEKTKHTIGELDSVDKRRLPSHLVEDLMSQLGVALIDLGRPIEAEKRLRAALDTLTSFPEELKKERWCVVAGKVAGTLRRALVFLGRADEAKVLQTEWLLREAELPHQKARAYCDLALVCLSLEQLAEARETLKMARNALSMCKADAREKTRGFIEAAEVRAGVSNPSIELGEPQWHTLSHLFKQLDLLGCLPRDEVAAWFKQHVLPQTRALKLIKRIVYLRPLAHQSFRLKDEVWFQGFIDQILAETCVENLGDTAIAALEQLKQGDGAPWLRVAPY